MREQRDKERQLGGGGVAMGERKTTITFLIYYNTAAV